VKHLAFAALLAASLATLHGQQQAPAAIHGRIVADDTGDPIPHARVVIWDDATAREPLFTAVDGTSRRNPCPSSAAASSSARRGTPPSTSHRSSTRWRMG